MDCAGKVKRRRRFERTRSVEVSNSRRADESGVALRLPPQSKTREDARDAISISITPRRKAVETLARTYTNSTRFSREALETVIRVNADLVVAVVERVVGLIGSFRPELVENTHGPMIVELVVERGTHPEIVVGSVRAAAIV
jgi:hypothetical protein